MSGMLLKTMKVLMMMKAKKMRTCQRRRGKQDNTEKEKLHQAGIKRITQRTQIQVLQLTRIQMMGWSMNMMKLKRLGFQKLIMILWLCINSIMGLPRMELLNQQNQQRRNQKKEPEPEPQMKKPKVKEKPKEAEEEPKKRTRARTSNEETKSERK